MKRISSAAKDYSSMKWTPWINVVETASVQKTRIAGGMFLWPEAGQEPIGQRIIEAPEKTNETETLRDPRSGFTALVPLGSIKKGQTLARRLRADHPAPCVTDEPREDSVRCRASRDDHQVISSASCTTCSRGRVPGSGAI